MTTELNSRFSTNSSKETHSDKQINVESESTETGIFISTIDPDTIHNDMEELIRFQVISSPYELFIMIIFFSRRGREKRVLFCCPPLLSMHVSIFLFSSNSGISIMLS